MNGLIQTNAQGYKFIQKERPPLFSGPPLLRIFRFVAYAFPLGNVAMQDLTPYVTPHAIC
jgi:hypothetical protein